VLRFGWARLAEFTRDHPGVDGPWWCTAGVWEAWVPRPGGDPTEGTVVVRGTLDEMLARLEEILAGGELASAGGGPRV